MRKTLKAPKTLVNGLAIAAGALLFALAFPNPLLPRGFPAAAWVAWAPVFFVINRAAIPALAAYGALYGAAAYSLFNYWLSAFHPLAGLLVTTIYLLYHAALFPILGLAARLSPRAGPLLQGLLWVAFEYLRTLGFLDYPYGLAGYTQWSVTPLLPLSRLTGVWGLSALVIFTNIVVERIVRGVGSWESGVGSRSQRDSLSNYREFSRKSDRFSPKIDSRLPIPDSRCKIHFPFPISHLPLPIPYLLLPLLFLLILLYGHATAKNRETAHYGTVKVALVQPNIDPWRGGLVEYRQNFQVLRRLSEEALAAKADTDLVVWPETAFVPRIFWHKTYRDDPDSYALVKELLDYLALQTVPFVIGNDDARREVNEHGKMERVDYNAVLLFEKGGITGVYRKMRLVPFTESFPYQKQLPWLYDILIKADTHFWKEGEESVVFNVNGMKFSSPVCFEDTFGYISRDFVKNGARLIVNLSNDAWSKSLPAQMQHLGMAVFRAAENGRSVVRSTASGQTCVIDPSGRILAEAAPFVETVLTHDAPISDEKTLYTLWGDWFPRLAMCLAGLLLSIFALHAIIMRRKL